MAPTCAHQTFINWHNISDRPESHCGLAKSGQSHWQVPTMGLRAIKMGLGESQSHPFRYSSNATNIPGLELRQKIANYLRNLIGAHHVKPSEIQQLLPQSMAQWGRLRIVDGDFIRAASTLSNEDDEKRDNTFVRFETEVGQNKHWVQILGYGQLLESLECRLPVDQRLRGFPGKHRLFAVIQPCSTVGRDATITVI
ncbi:hypothetical protein GGX14DRAFT_644450 [Mycena pura]|uniref:Uncharacterized protein n=1 Tax=Mycena pura TaxID=153505 RepID=A0AAD6Y8S1_9AGAR|nr:hypothetical protein GGX14DRAFT_644450 [Mycena pura]